MSTREEVDAINGQYARAMQEQDVAGLISLYADDARLFFSDKPIIHGRESIAAAYAEELKDGPIVIEFDSVDVLDSGEMVVDIGHYASPREQGKYVVVFRRQADGALKIAVEADITDRP
jgi:ketosteroid isomerase-like protein